MVEFHSLLEPGFIKKKLTALLRRRFSWTKNMGAELKDVRAKQQKRRIYTLNQGEPKSEKHSQTRGVKLRRCDNFYKWYFYIPTNANYALNKRSGL